MKITVIDKVLLALSFLSLYCVGINASTPVKNVTGVYTYYGDKKDSPADCKRIAAQMARIDALKKDFGTVVSQNTIISSDDSNKGYETRFLSLSESEVKGEWLGDTGEPEYVIEFGTDDSLIVTCRVQGKARAISNEAVEFEALVLRNGNDRRNADTHFKDNDDLFLYFSAPVNGYLSFFLQDETGTVYRLLPYPHSDVEEILVKKGYDYVFLDPSKLSTQFGNVEPVYVSAPDRKEYNKVYVVFSPERFSSPLVRFMDPDTPPSISGEEFSKWLIKSRRADPRMGVKSIMLVIEPSDSSMVTHRNR